MIITKQKPFEVIKEYLRDNKKIFIVGCGECATLCKTGGPDEIAEMAQMLRDAGKEVTGGFVAIAPCNIVGTKIEMKKQGEPVREADAVIVLSCGAGVGSIAETYEDKNVIPGCDSLFLGNTIRVGSYDERCMTCGECILEETGGICPVTTCAKGLLNGPCGGMNNGKCEISPDIECAWVRIYRRLEKKGKLDRMEKIHEAKDYSKHTKPGVFEGEKYAKMRKRPEGGKR